MSSCGNPVAEIATVAATSDWKKKLQSGQKIPASYTDTLPSTVQQQNPTGEVTYAVEVLNTKGRGAGLSNQVHVPTTPTLPPPADVKAEIMAEGVVLTFAGIPDEHPSPDISHHYRIYRRTVAATTLTAELPLENSEPLRVVDHSFEWEKTYDYFVTVVSIVTQPGKPKLEIEGDDSPAERVFAHDIFPPAVPSGLQAVFAAEGQQRFIDLVWAPDTDADLAGYNVYRREANGEALRINAALVTTPAYRDVNVEPGKEYFYSVSAVDVRGNESARSEEASEKVPQ
jgi:hypothetical protein